MELREPVMVCDNREQGGCDTVGICVGAAPATTLDGLVQAMERWHRGHASYSPRSFSHSIGTGWKRRAGLAGPEAVTVYTGVLLVQAPQGAGDGVELSDVVRAAFPHLG